MQKAFLAGALLALSGWACSSDDSGSGKEPLGNPDGGAGVDAAMPETPGTDTETDAGLPPVSCNAVANTGCGAGQLCRWALNGDRFECVDAPANPVAVEEACSADPDDCGPGLVCYRGACLAVCDAAASTCDNVPGSQQVAHLCRSVVGASAAKVCVGSPCTPSEDRCAADEACVPTDANGTTFDCTPAGTQARGQACGGANGNCQKGLICIPGQAGAAVCTEVCQAGVAGSCSEADAVCIDGSQAGIAFDLCLSGCDPLNDQCGAGEGCTPVSQTEYACAPSGPNTAGAACGQVAGLCERGTFCLPDGQGAASCVAFCDPTDAMACGGQAACVTLPAPGQNGPVGFCSLDASCDILNDTCPAGEACYPLSLQEFSCATEGTTPLGASCQGIRNECVPGAICAGASAASQTCLEVCDLANPACPAGAQCAGIQGATFGVCIVP